MKPTLVILCIEKRLAAWHLTTSSTPKRLPIQGQEHLDLSSKEALAGAYADLAERLQGEKVEQIHWLIDKHSRTLLTDSLPLQKGFPNSPIWQLLAWEWLAERLGLNGTAQQVISSFAKSELLPWLASVDDALERQQMKEALSREHNSESERLLAERVALQQENERLREKNAALQQVDVEPLLSYLPALFHRVFTVLGATDLALLCGRIEPLSIPNPYPEPSEEALRVLQKNFRTLPRKLQQQIVGFVARLPQRQKLQPRSEMRELLHELEQV